MDKLIHLIYASTAKPAFTKRGLPALLSQARSRNTDALITGMLLQIDGSFCQILEGKEANVTALYGRICADERHCDLVQIVREPIAYRGFADWTMGFCALEAGEVDSLLGEHRVFADASSLRRMGPDRAKKLMQSFKRGRWRADEDESFALTA